MMNANDLFKAGKLQEAITTQIQAVKSNPADHSRRLFLFELLAFAGDLDRAVRQIEAINYGEMELDTAVLSYRRLLDAERTRRKVFADGQQPQFLTEVTPATQLRLDALARLRENRLAEASALVAEAAATSPSVVGTLNGKPVASVRDCDDLFGTVLEVMAHGDYYWVPFEHIHSLTMGSPKSPRDLLWVPARLETEGAAGDVFLPALYPGSHEHPDDQVKLGRATDWKSADGGPVLGVGLRTFLADEDAISLLEWREFQLQVST